MDSQTALITGASAGIGLELARLFAADESISNLALVARRADRLEQLAAELRAQHDVQVHVLPADLADRAAPAAIVAQLQRLGLDVDVLVNNAGFGVVGQFADAPLTRLMDMLQVHVAAVTELTGLLLPGMIHRRRGGILNVASTAAFQPGPGMAIYYATKAYLLSFTEALAEELKGTGVRATCLAPGPTTTEFAEVAGLRLAPLFARGAMSAAAVARAGYCGFNRGKVLVMPGLRNRIGAMLVRLSPRSLVRKVVKRINRPG